MGARGRDALPYSSRNCFLIARARTHATTIVYAIDVSTGPVSAASINELSATRLVGYTAQNAEGTTETPGPGGRGASGCEGWN